MSGKLLIFEFNRLLDALEVDRKMALLDVAVVPVARKNYNKPLEDLADEWSDVYDEDADNEDYTGGPLGGQMIVLCDLEEEQLDEVLRGLRIAGVGRDCLKALMTDANREWDPVTLYKELQREHQSFQGK